MLTLEEDAIDLSFKLTTFCHGAGGYFNFAGYLVYGGLLVKSEYTIRKIVYWPFCGYKHKFVKTLSATRLSIKHDHPPKTKVARFCCF